MRKLGSLTSDYTTKPQSSKRYGRGFLGGPVVKNPLAKAGDMNLIPGLRISHIPQGN